MTMVVNMLRGFRVKKDNLYFSFNSSQLNSNADRKELKGYLKWIERVRYNPLGDDPFISSRMFPGIRQALLFDFFILSEHRHTAVEKQTETALFFYWRLVFSVKVYIRIFEGPKKRNSPWLKRQRYTTESKADRHMK